MSYKILRKDPRSASIRRSRSTTYPRIDFQAIARSAIPRLPELVSRWLPDGHRRGGEWTARNPTRDDHHPGSFSINLMSGCWSDFATGDRGGDAVSLAAYLFRLSQVEAARQVAAMIGLDMRHG